MEQLVRSRSYPGFSIGILLSVKMILPVNSVFIPLLNEIHRSMERERGNRRWRESERERHDKEKRKLPLPSPSFSFPFLPTVCAPLGHTIANENTAWDKQLLSDWSK